jgi:hypothetical protein
VFRIFASFNQTQAQPGYFLGAVGQLRQRWQCLTIVPQRARKLARDARSARRKLDLALLFQSGQPDTGRAGARLALGVEPAG